MATPNTSGSQPEITLHDVIAHMGHMEQRLSAAIAENTRAIGRNSHDIGHLTQRIDTLETHLTRRIDTLEDDLTQRMDTLEDDLKVTIKEMLTIRRHVGMGVPEDE